MKPTYQKPTYEQTWKCAAVDCVAIASTSGQGERLPDGWYQMSLRRRATRKEQALASGEMHAYLRETNDIALCPDCADNHLDLLKAEVARCAVPFGYR